MRRFPWILAIALVLGGRFGPGPIAASAFAEDDEPLEPAPPETEPPRDEPAPPDTEPPQEEPTPESFNSALGPYGQWYFRASLNAWAWHPSAAAVGTDFRPYETNGHWVYSPEGWAFTSTLPFGWAVFHYGRWYQDDVYGWLWMPGDTWAPAWVDWREGGGYVGWAPLPPENVDTEGVDVSTEWCFVAAPFFAATDLFVHVVTPVEGRHVYVVTQPMNRPTVVQGVSWNRGPDVKTVRQAGARVDVTTSLRPRTVPYAGSRTVPYAGSRAGASSQAGRYAPTRDASPRPATTRPSTPMAYGRVGLVAQPRAVAPAASPAVASKHR
jgi:hypothetical protein